MTEKKYVKKLAWTLSIECSDPIVIQGDARTEMLIKNFNKFYETLMKTLGNTKTAKMNLLKICKPVIETEFSDGTKEVVQFG